MCVGWEDWREVFSRVILHDCHLYLDFYLREEGQTSFFCFFFFYAYALFFRSLALRAWAGQLNPTVP